MSIIRTVWTRWAVILILLITVILPLLQAPVGAESGTPEAAAVITSPSREEVKRQIREAFPFEEPQQQGGQVIATGYDPATLNGILASDSVTFWITGWIYETLLGANPVDGTPVPGLADRWEIAPDRVTYTFHLNQDARWQDGVDLTAEDVKFSFDAQLNPDTGSAYTTSTAALVASYRVIDENTFEVVANDPFVTFLYDLFVPILPKHVWQDVPPGEWMSDPGSTGQDPSRVIGSGPFIFKEWIQGERIVLERNAEYWGDVPIIDELVYQIFPDPVSEKQALKTGQIDIADTPLPADVAELAATDGLAVAIYEATDFAGFFLNLDAAKSPLLQDQEVRQALLYALDREAINDAIYYGLGVVAVGVQSPLSPAYVPEAITHAYPYDPDQARALLAQAGWTDTNGDGIVEKDGNELRITLLDTTGESAAVWEQLLSYIQDAWLAVGIGFDIEAVSPDEWYDRVYVSHDFEVYYSSFFFGFSGDQGPLFRCDENGPYGFNSMSYCNPRYDDLDDQQRREFDPERRLELMIELNNLVAEDLPVAAVRFPMSRTAYSTRLHNYFPNSFGGPWWSLPYVWVEPGA